MPVVDKLNIPINLRLDQDVLETIVSRIGVSQDAATQMIAAAANQLVMAYYMGGIVLSVDDVKRVEKALGKPVAAADDVVRAIQKSAGRDDGMLTIKAQLDPSFEEPLREHAASLGWTIPDVLKEVVETAMLNGWCHQFTAPGKPLFLSDENTEKIRRLTGKKAFGGDDIVETLSRRNRTATTQEPA